SSFGGIFKKDIPAGKQFIVDNGHLVAFPSSMNYEIKSVGGDIVNMVTSGEGLACVFTGPGTVYLQSRNLRTFAETLNPFLPQREKSQGQAILGRVFG
ncbi:MAG TPA: AIM24 family protein, partial [Candidatus Peribacteria bacterium]|nr:AIM24 family protein [Candidatus Peribacteria bacterium]